MIANLPKYLIQAVLLIAAQVLVFSNIGFAGVINPYPYIYFLLLMPDTFKGGKALAIGFVFGLIIDMFMDTGGMHASACTFLVFVRPIILRNISSVDGYGDVLVPNAKRNGLRWFISYSAVVVALHHIWLFYFEVFRFSEFFHTMMRAAGSWFFSMIIIVVIQVLSNTEAKR